MKIRQTTYNDLPVLLETFDYGRQQLRRLGNHYQWRNGHPKQEVLEQDIQSGTSYVCVADEHGPQGVAVGTVVATFYILKGENPLFNSIEDGDWLNEGPYVTVHRMCANGKLKGACQFCVRWITERYPNVRIFTHETNQPMLHIVKKLGFQYCGEIFPQDGIPRKAYQYVRQQ